MPKEKPPAEKDYRIRIVGFDYLEASMIYPSPHNWRLHLDPQREAMSLILSQIGVIGAVIVRTVSKNKYELIDGHLRKDVIGTRQKVPALITDLTAEESRAAITVFDPIGAMAGQDSEQLSLNLKWLEKAGDTISKAVFPDYIRNPLLTASWEPGEPGEMPEREDGGRPASGNADAQPIIVTKKERSVIEKAIGRYLAVHPDAEDETEGHILSLICKAFK